MGIFRWFFRKLGGLGRGVAMRSKWLARRLWVVALADVLLTTRRHWVRLEPNDRKRLFELARKSEGRPGKNLSAKERQEANDLLDELGHIEYAGNVAGIVLPFRPLSRIVTKFLEGRRRDAKKKLAEADAGAAKASAEGNGARPPESEPKADSKA
jgi:hypothetical protein